MRMAQQRSVRQGRALRLAAKPQRCAMGPMRAYLPLLIILFAASATTPGLSPTERRLLAAKTTRSRGPAYEDKVAKVGIWVQDIFDEQILRAELRAALGEKNAVFESIHKGCTLGRVPGPAGHKLAGCALGGRRDRDLRWLSAKDKPLRELPDQPERRSSCLVRLQRAVRVERGHDGCKERLARGGKGHG